MEIRLLKLLALAHVVVGLALTIFLFVKPLHPIFLNIIYPNGTTNEEQIVFWVSIFGPTLSSWGVLFYLGIQSYVHNQSNETFRLLLVALLVWAPLDSVLCLYNGIYFGAILNIIVLSIFLILLFRIKPKAYNQAVK